MQYLDQVILGNEKRGRIALIDGRHQYTYFQLVQKVNCVAEYLIKKGVKHQDRVMIVLDKSIKFIICQLAVMKVGAIAIPTDSSLPLKRVTNIIDICNPNYLICKRGYIDVTVQQLYKEEIDNVIFYETSSDEEMVSKRINNLNRKEDDIAYIIFTSGSTGEPKGVMIKHKSVMHFISIINNFMRYNENTKMLSVAPLFFDTSIHEIYCTLAAGGMVYVMEKLQHMTLFKRIIEKYHITDLVIVSTIFNMLNSYLDENNCKQFSSLKKILYCGEACDSNIVLGMKKMLPGVTIVQGYGPTETTVGCVFKEIVDEETYGYGVFPLGRPLEGTKIILVNEKGEIANTNEVGEAYIGGAQLMAGYCNNSTLTQKVLVKDNKISKELMYKSGDFMLKLPNGEYVFCGRKDDAVKLNGKLVCLSEIVFAVQQIRQIEQAFVLPYKDCKQFTRIGLLYVVKEDIKSDEIIRILKQALPEYMIPYKVLEINKEDIVYKETGKVDKHILGETLYSNINERREI